MSFTRNWSATILNDASQAKTIDDKFTELQVNIKERIDSLLKSGTDIDDDPLTLKDEVTGVVTGRKLMFGTSGLSALSGTLTPGAANYSITGTAHLDIVLPIGYTITLAEAWIGAGSGSTTSFQLVHVNPLSGAVTNVMSAAVSTATNAVNLKSSSALTHVTIDGVIYRVLFVHHGATGFVAGFLLTINRSSDNRLGY